MSGCHYPRPQTGDDLSGPGPADRASGLRGEAQVGVGLQRQQRTGGHLQG